MAGTRQRVSPTMIGPSPWDCSKLTYTSQGVETSAHQMEEMFPLDLSMRPSTGPEPPYSPQRVPPESKPSQDLPMCLIKYCACDKHGPNIRGSASTSLYGDVKYEQQTGTPGRRFIPPEARSGDTEIGACDSRGYECSSAPRRDTWPEEGNPWAARRQYCDERMDANAGQCGEVGTSAQNRFSLPLGAGNRNDHATPSNNYGSKYYDDHNTQSFLDLINSGNGMETAWKTPTNNEESSNEESNSAQTWKLKRNWSRTTSDPPKIHWRPFGDSTTHSASPPPVTSHRPSQEFVAETSSQKSEPQTVCVTSEGSESAAPGSGGKVIILSTAPSQPPIIRTVGHCFASTIPLISHSVPTGPEARDLQASDGPRSKIMFTRPTFSSITVTRSPKTFHHEFDRTLHENGGRGQAVKRSQDGGKCQVLDTSELQEKENMILSTGNDIPPDAVRTGVKMPALDYLISKVLVERIDIPFKPCNTEIKKIYNGESKGRLRLVDLIELQVEESLKV